MSRAEADMVTTLGGSPMTSPVTFADGHLDALAADDDEEAQILPSQTVSNHGLNLLAWQISLSMPQVHALHLVRLDWIHCCML